MTTTTGMTAGTAVPSLPAGRFGVDTTTVDGRPYAMLYCVRCHRYAHNVSSRGIRSRVGDLFRQHDLGGLLAAAAGHECPPEVVLAAPKGQDPQE